MEKHLIGTSKTKATLCRMISAAYFLVFLLPVVGLADTTTVLALTPQSSNDSEGRKQMTGQRRHHPFRPGIPMAMVVSGGSAFDSGFVGLSVRRTLFYSQKDDVSADHYSDSPKTKSRLFRDLGCAAKIALSDIAHIYTSPARMNARHALWLGGILAVGGAIFAYDQEIYDALKRNENTKYYKPIREVGEFFEPLGYMGFTNKFLFAALAIGYIAKIEPMVEISFDVLEHFLVASPGKNAMMILAGRRGPMLEQGPRSRKFNDGRSFPSGHSLAIMQLASVLSHHVDYVPFKVAAYGAAGTVLLQRITSDHHWPSDVYGGAVYGWILTHELLKLKKNRGIKITPTTWNGGKGAGLILTLGF